MWTLQGKSQDHYSKILINEAIMCKLFHCTPSQLECEDAQKLEVFQLIYSKIGDKNPLFLL